MTKRCAGVFVAACVIASVMAVGAAADVLPRALSHPGPIAGSAPVRILTLGHVRSRLLDDLQRLLGTQLQIHSAAVGAPAADEAHQYRMLVIGGGTLAARRTRSLRALRRFSDAGDWVLVLGARRSEQRALYRETGLMAVPRRRGRRAARARQAIYLFTRGLVGATEQVFILDVPTLGASGPGRLSAAARRRLFSDGTLRTVRLLEAGLRAGPQVVLRQSAGRGDAGLPPEIQHVGYEYVQESPAGGFALPNGNWTSNRDLIGVPTPGQQAASWTVAHNFDVYLDNAQRPQGNYQVVTYNLAGQFNPAINQQFFQMNNPFQIGFTDDKILERAFWTGSIEPYVSPFADSDSDLTWQANAPQTPNEETTYSSGNDFQIGFSGESGPSANYTISNQQDHTISDWGVQSLSDSNHLHWLFTARHPCDVRDEVSNQNGCFDGAVPGLPTKPNELSLGQIQFNASGRWKTKSVLSGSDGQLQFATNDHIEVVDTYCRTWFIAACGPDRIGEERGVGPQPTMFDVDASAVNPIPIASLTLSPNPANGTKQQTVTGTVTLQRPAPMDITVVISSNSGNAIVGQPVNGGQGSSTTITIGKDQTSGTFTVQTNDNGLKSHGHTTAAISAFYTTPTTKQLQINRP